MMTGCVFSILFFAVILIDVAYFAWFICKPNWRNTTVQSCQMYVEVAKGLIISAGVVTAVLAGALESGSSIPHRLSGPTIFYLATAMAFSLLLIMVLTRATEAAIARETEKGGQVQNGGMLKWYEFGLEMICGFVALGTFLLGILYLGRIGFFLWRH